MAFGKHNVLLVCATAMLAACGGADEASSDAASSSSESAPTDVAEMPEVPVSFADLSGDAGAGERVFGQCSACHSVVAGENRAGPSLAGIIGQQAGSVEGFNYSPANAELDVVWTAEEMFNYLENPREMVPGTRMAFPGVRDPQDRADLVAYLQSVSE